MANHPPGSKSSVVLPDRFASPTMGRAEAVVEAPAYTPLPPGRKAGASPETPAGFGLSPFGIFPFGG